MSTQSQAADYCSLVPDSPFGFDFSGICAIHDQAYSEGSGVSRSEADRAFRDGLHNTCSEKYGGSWLCHITAEVYFIGVWLFGGLFYEGGN